MKQPISLPNGPLFLRITLVALLAIFFFPQTSKASVTWGTTNAFQWQDTLVVQWTTTTETNNVQFWLEIPGIGLLQPLGPYSSSVQNSTTPTSYEVKYPIPFILFPPGGFCGFIWPDDGTGWDPGNSSPMTCFFLTTPGSLVWPGDANNDGTANVQDLLNIGIANGQTGPIRAGGTSWIGNTCTDWSNSFANGLNHKFADCDGNGTVNLNDTLAINLNYGLTHNKTTTTTTDGIPLTFIYPDSANANDTIEVEIWLGSAITPVPEAYGLAFSMNYDTSQVLLGNISSTLETSWFGTPGTDMVQMNHDDLVSQFDVAFTRTNGINAAGYGRIGSIGIVLVDNLGKTNFDAKLLLDFFNPILLNNIGEPVTVNLDIVVGLEQNIHALNSQEMKVYPVPAKDELFIEVSETGIDEFTSATLYDITGKTHVRDLHYSEGTYRVGLESIPQGVYLLHLSNSKHQIFKKVIVK